LIIRITDHCTMGCPHCLVDAKPDGLHMDRRTFEEAVLFNSGSGLPLIITGGEPTDHPEIVSFLDYVNGMHVTVLSNGLFLKNAKLREKILARVSLVQITNDPRYYPQKVIPFDHHKIMFENSLRCLSPFGRALRNGMACTIKSPLCFNLRSAVRYMDNFLQAVQLLALKGKMCCPSINVDGTISAGETPSCYQIGTVWDTYEKVASAIKAMKCNRCGLVDNLAPNYKAAIGE